MQSPMTNFFPHDITMRETDEKKIAFLCFFSPTTPHQILCFLLSFRSYRRLDYSLVSLALLSATLPATPQLAPSLSRPNVHSVVPAQFAGLPSHPNSSSVRPTAAKTHPAPPLHNASSPNDRPRLHALQPTRLTIPAYPPVCPPALPPQHFPPPQAKKWATDRFKM